MSNIGVKDTRFIAVDLYIIDNGFDTSGYILLRDDIAGFTYSKHYTGPDLDPVNLRRGYQKSFKPRAHETLHDVFKDTLPGYWGARQLTEENPDYAQMPDIEKMFWLGSRSSGGLRFRCYKKPGEESPIRGIDILRKIEQKSIEFVTGNHEKGRPIYDESTKWAVVSGGGARPKAQFSRNKGTKENPLFVDMIAKFNVPHDPYNMAKMEHAMLELSKKAGLDTPKSYVLPAANGGEDIFLVERYDRHLKERKHTISLATLVGVDNTSQGKVACSDYIDIVKAIKESSSDPAADIRELYGRMILAAACNITDNHLRNYEMISDNNKGYRLSPNFDLVPDPWNTPFATHMCRYTRGDSVDFMSLKFIENTAAKMGIPEGEAKKIANRVVTAVLNSDEILNKAKMSENDKKIFKKTINEERLEKLVKDIKRSTPELTANNDFTFR